MKHTLRIYNVAQDGFAFAINEETGQTVFLSRQLCTANDITEEDVSREVECIVTEGTKGPQALTLDFPEEASDDEIIQRLEDLSNRIKALEDLL